MNEIDSRPLYEADQVVTYKELHMMREGCIYQYHAAPWWNLIEKLKVRAAMGCITAMLLWIKNGKPIVRLKKESL